MGNIGLVECVYDVVKQIPKGKVMTYGQIAEILNYELRIRNYGRKVTPRLVGNALHKNPDPKNIPCHRVVNSKGRIAEKYAYGGWKEQRRKLLEEGVGFKDKLHVDLEKHLIQQVLNFEV